MKTIYRKILASTLMLGMCGIANIAKADEETSGKHVPFLVFDLAGGAGLPANFLVGKKAGPYDLLSSYNQLGWSPRKSGAVDNRFGLPMANKDISKVLAGMLSVMSENAQANLRMASILNISQD